MLGPLAKVSRGQPATGCATEMLSTSRGHSPGRPSSCGCPNGFASRRTITVYGHLVSRGWLVPSHGYGLVGGEQSLRAMPCLHTAAGAHHSLAFAQPSRRQGKTEMPHAVIGCYSCTRTNKCTGSAQEHVYVVATRARQSFLRIAHDGPWFPRIQ